MTANSQAAVFSSELQQAKDGTWGYCIKRIDTSDIVCQCYGHTKDFALELMEYDLIALEDDEANNWRNVHDFVYEVARSDDGLWQYQIHEKSTQKIVSAQSGLRCQDTAYAHIRNALIAAGCRPNEAAIHVNVGGFGNASEGA